jgi:agmatinase
MYSIGFIGIASLAIAVTARDIIFPPLIPQHPLFNILDDSRSAWTDVPGAVAGLTTFANIPHVFCLADAENKAVEKFDIAFLGAPFDTVRSSVVTSHSLLTAATVPVHPR